MDAWCFITVCGVSAFTVDTHGILQRGIGFLWDCLREGRVPKLAGLPALMLYYKMTENVVKTKLRNKFYKALKHLESSKYCTFPQTDTTSCR